MKDEIRENALEYHRSNPPGKLAIRATKPLANQYDLAMAQMSGGSNMVAFEVGAGSDGIKTGNGREGGVVQDFFRNRRI